MTLAIFGCIPGNDKLVNPKHLDLSCEVLWVSFMWPLSAPSLAQVLCYLVAVI